MTLEIRYHKKVDYGYIDLDDIVEIYNLQDRGKPNKPLFVIIPKQEYIVLKEKANILEQNQNKTLFE